MFSLLMQEAKAFSFRETSMMSRDPNPSTTSSTDGGHFDLTRFKYCKVPKLNCQLGSPVPHPATARALIVDAGRLALALTLPCVCAAPAAGETTATLNTGE